MKLKINKACDLSSISVLPPPQSRRLSAAGPPGPQSSQLRSQPSQQSFSQGISSQHGMFSQLSQTSLDEALTNDLRFNSQERENSVKKTSCLPISRSSTNVMRKWNPASIPDYTCQVNEELEHRIGMMETSLNKIALILDSVQSDVMHVNKGTKEVSLETEGIRQKLIVLDASLQLMNKRQEDVKFTLDGSLKSISEQLSKDVCQDKLQQIFLQLSALSQQIDASLVKLQHELRMTLTKQMQAMAGSMKAPNLKSPSITMLSPKVTGQATLQRKPVPLKNAAISTVVSKVEMGGWNSVKVEQGTSMRKAPQKEQKRKGPSSIQQSMMQEGQCRVIIESDEDIDGGFSCLIDEKETGIRNYMIEEAREETDRILRKARRRKRKSCNPIIIN